MGAAATINNMKNTSRLVGAIVAADDKRSIMHSAQPTQPACRPLAASWLVELAPVWNATIFGETAEMRHVTISTHSTPSFELQE